MELTSKDAPGDHACVERKHVGLEAAQDDDSDFLGAVDRAGELFVGTG